MGRRAAKKRCYCQAQESSFQAEVIQGSCHKLRQSPLQGIDWIITNDLDKTVITQVAQEANDLRWQVKEFHIMPIGYRELKQLTGSAKCQCRKARSQRNHLACCYHAWLSLKVQAALVHKIRYRVRTDLFSNYLRSALRSPSIPAFQPVWRKSYS